MRIECSRCKALSDSETTLTLRPRYIIRVGEIEEFALCFSCREALVRWIEDGERNKDGVGYRKEVSRCHTES